MAAETPPRATDDTAYDLAGLERYAAAYRYCEPTFRSRSRVNPTHACCCIGRDTSVDLVLICVVAGQVSSVHDRWGVIASSA